MQEPDPETIRRAAAGDLDAFAELVRDSQADVWRFIRHLVHDDELAADLTQDTYLRVHRAIGGFRGDSLFRTWLFSIARNLVVDHRRRAGRQARTVSLDLHHADRILAVGAPPPQQAELRAAIAQLAPRQREAFVLVEVFGMRYREAAVVLGIPEGTVKSRTYHARSTLVHWFDDTRSEDHG